MGTEQTKTNKSLDHKFYQTISKMQEKQQNNNTTSYIDEILEQVLPKKSATVEKRNSIICPEREAKMHKQIDELIQRRRSSAKLEESEALKKYQEVHLMNGMRMDSKFLMKTNELIMEYVERTHR